MDIKREKIIQEFDFLIRDFCPSCTSDERYLEVLKAVRELLKERETVEPITQIDRDEDYIFLCSNCSGEIFGGDVLHDNYCTTCGGLVNWHGRYNI